MRWSVSAKYQRRVTEARIVSPLVNFALSALGLSRSVRDRATEDRHLRNLRLDRGGPKFRPLHFLEKSATCGHGELMRFPAKKKTASAAIRQDELRKARAAAPTLSVACPEAAVVRVELEFQADPLLAHAAQTLSIYPPAKAHFSYACPFGDCDGVYDLNEIALASLKAGKKKTRGTLACSGHRSRDGKVGSLCDLALSYSITVAGHGVRASTGAAQPASEPR